MRKSKWTYESYYPRHFSFKYPSLWHVWWWFGYHGLYQINWWWKRHNTAKSKPRKDVE